MLHFTSIIKVFIAGFYNSLAKPM